MKEINLYSSYFEFMSALKVNKHLSMLIRKPFFHILFSNSNYIAITCRLNGTYYVSFGIRSKPIFYSNKYIKVKPYLSYENDII